MEPGTPGYEVTKRPNKLENFHSKILELGLIFASKAGAYPSGTPFKYSPLG